MIKKLFLCVFTTLFFAWNSSAQSVSMIGDAVSGWSTDVVMSTTDNVTYTLSNFTFSNGGAKFRQDANWGTNWGANAFPSGTANLNGSNIPVIAGVYNVTFNRTTRAYNFETVAQGFDSISISGSAGPGANADVSMLTVDGVNYSLDNYTLTAGTLIFRKDNSSAVSWGSASFPTGTATLGGAAMNVSPGTYDIKFNKTTGVYSFNFAVIGIIGSATPGGWGADTLMTTTDGVNYTLEGATLVAGELKFRQNQSWTINWGASAFPSGTATLNGNNIPVVAGTYTITFNKSTGVYNFSAGYPVVNLYAEGGSTVELITLDGSNYYINNYSIASGDYKFRQGNSTTNIWGAAAFPSGTATLGGASIPVIGGDYNIQFNKTTGAYSFNYLTISVIGSATPGGWSTDTNMTTTNGVNYSLSGLALVAGELKFRQGNDWSVNWGGNSFPGGTGNLNGSNIGVQTGSTFTATFNRQTGAYYFYDEVNLQVNSPVNLCKGTAATSLAGSVFAVPGSVVKWYTLATGGTASITAPLAYATVLGAKTFYVSQTIGGVEGPRAAIVVNVNDVPTTPGIITGATAQGVLVGTATTATYSIAEVASAVSYTWTAPAGVNIVSGQGTNTVVVNFLNVAAGAGAIGNLSVRSVNANGCSSAARTSALTKALPTAPVLLTLTNGVTTTGITNISAFVGTTTALTLTAGNVATATGYAWNLPAGVTQVSGGNSRIIQVNFAGLNAGDISSVVIGVSSINGVGTSTTAKTLSLLRALPTAPLVLSMTNPASATPTTAITAVSPFIGTSTTLTLTATAVSTAASYVWTLPAGVNQVGGGANDRIIQVNFAGVPAGNSGVALNISVAAANGIGTSALKTLALTRTVPGAPITLTLTNPASATPTTAITAANTLIGTSTTYTLTASAVTTASSYNWTLPAGVNQVGGGANDRIIQVNFADVPAGNAGVALPITVKGANGVGESVAKTLALTRVLPSTVVTVTGQIGAICGGNTYNYTMTPALYTNAYQITAPVGSIVTSASNPSNASNVLTTSDLTFSVALPANFSTLAAKTIVIYSKNGVGLSATAKTLTLNPASPTIPAVNGGTTFTTCANVTFSVADMVGASSYVWTMANGAVIVSGQGTNTVVVSFAAVTVPSTLLRVKAISNCGVAGADKYIALTNVACFTGNDDTTAKISNVSEVYPNPVVDAFTLEMQSSKATAAQMQVYTFEGNLLLSKQINLAEGENTVSESVAELKKGLYIVKITNEATNEVVVKKMIKQ
jgi:hypothetical protein